MKALAALLLLTLHGCVTVDSFTLEACDGDQCVRGTAHFKPSAQK